MGLLALFAVIGCAAVIAAGAILAANVRQILHNRRILLELQRRAARERAARQVLALVRKR